MIKHTIEVMGKRTAYWERNPQWDKTVVMLHGFRGNHKGLTDMVQHFAGWRVVLPDLPGYGESEPLDVPHTLANYAEWLDEFVVAMGPEDWVSWSHSYGGLIALVHGATGRHKPSAFVSVSLADARQDYAAWLTSMYYQAGRVMPYEMQRRWLASRTIDKMSQRMLITGVSARRRQEMVKRGEANLGTLNPRVITDQYFSAIRTPMEPYAAHLDMPALLIAGAKDVMVPVKRLERLMSVMPDGTLVIMEDQGHLAPIERPAATATITKRFLNGIEQPALV